MNNNKRTQKKLEQFKRAREEDLKIYQRTQNKHDLRRIQVWDEIIAKTEITA